MDIKGIYFENYKCFEKGMISNIKPINIIFGKNNIGKSSMLDVIQNIYSTTKTTQEMIMIEKELTEEEISSVFSKYDFITGMGINEYDFGKKFMGKNFWVELTKTGKRYRPDIMTNGEIYNDRYNEYWERLGMKVKFMPKKIKRIYAERNVLAEDLIKEMQVDGNGNGVTNYINNFLNNEKLEEDLVRKKLLTKLNEIMGEDATFTEIVTQQIEVDGVTKWEIFLKEEGKRRVALSASGSGLKTILMVLVYTILVPKEEKLSNYLFLFEELENNLHPSLQRRLLSYIEELSKEGATFFLTTHSNVVLDAFQNNDDVNMLHVLKDENNKVTIVNVSDNLQKNNVLNDLGIKASDVLQSNGIIWVEGPSDRIYINKWIDLWSNGEIKEGKHYQCVFYGGRLLSNVTLTEKEENDLINLLNVNRNSIILIDSDKKNKQASINDTKKRIEAEANKNNILCWITKGREIENYVPEKLIKQIIENEDNVESFEQYQNIEDFLNNVQQGLGNKFLKDKIGYAKIFTDNVQIDDFKDSLDLNNKMIEVIEQIEQWNK